MTNIINRIGRWGLEHPILMGVAIIGFFILFAIIQIVIFNPQKANLITDCKPIIILYNCNEYNKTHQICQAKNNCNRSMNNITIIKE